MRRWALVAAFVVSTAAQAAVLTTKSGTLGTFTDTGTGTNYVSPEGSGALLVTYTTTGGATIKLQVSTDGVDWTDVTDSAEAVTSAAVTAVSVSDPVGLYRAVVTAHSSGTHTVKYRYAR